MAKNPEAPFAQTPKRIYARVTAAHTSLNDKTDDCVLAYTAGSDGAVITRLVFIPTETNAGAGVAYAYRAASAGGTVDMLAMKAVASVTVSTTAAGGTVDMGPSETVPWRMEAGECLYVAHSLAKTGTFVGDAMDY